MSHPDASTPSERPRLLLIGPLRRDFILFPGEPPRLDIPGGSLLYAAAGAAVWEKSLALVAQVGRDFPEHWLEALEQRGLERRAVRRLDEPLEMRTVQAYDTAQRPCPSLPRCFREHGLPFPQALLGYQAEKSAAATEALIPPPFELPFAVAAAYLCAMSPERIRQWIAYLHTSHTGALLVASFPVLKQPPRLLDLLLQQLEGLDALLLSEKALRRLFWGKTDDLGRMVSELLAAVPLVVVQHAQQHCLLATGAERWEVPAYPAGEIPIGLEEAFGGGFLVDLWRSRQPLTAATYGAISASFKSESSDPFYTWEILPGLAEARRQQLQLHLRPSDV